MLFQGQRVVFWESDPVHTKSSGSYRINRPVWSAIADLLSYRVRDGNEEDMPGQAMVGEPGPGTLASGDGIDSTDSQVVLGVVHVHVDVVVLCKDTYVNVYIGSNSAVQLFNGHHFPTLVQKRRPWGHTKDGR